MRRRVRQHLLSLAERIRWNQDGPGEASEGVGEAERSTEEVGGRGRAGQGDSAEGGVGKLLSPLKRRRTVEHVRLRPAYRYHVWTYDFVFSLTHAGRPIRHADAA